MMDTDTNKNSKLKDSFSLQATNRVLDILKKYPTKITDVSQLKDIKYIGAHTLKRIDEILKSGKLDEIDDDIISEKYLQYINELVKVYGIGTSMANKLYKNYNVKSIADLKKISKEIKLPDSVLTGIKYIGLSKENIPRDEMELIDNYLKQQINKVDIHLYGLICGSYRRNTGTNKTSNDIDLILIHPSNDNMYLHKLIQILKEDKFIIASLTAENVKTKYMGLCKLNKSQWIRRLDIRFIPMESYYYAILYFTGPRDFNRKMRMIAQSMSMTLNEYGLYTKDNKRIPAKSEKEIFDKLKMEYVVPELRQ